MRIRAVVLCLAVLTMALACASASAVTRGTATITIHPGENWISASVIPLNPDPASIFAGIEIDGKLATFDPRTQSPVIYHSSNPDAFGGLLAGGGYILTYTGTSPTTVTYDGVVLDDTDLWISLPGGEQWIGNNLACNVLMDTIVVTDGSEAYYLPEAVTRGWIGGTWYTLDAATQTPQTVSVSSLSADDHYLRNGYMYKVTTYRENMALILPAPEPSSLLALLGGLAGFAWRRRR